MKSVSVVGNLVSDCGVPENWENINKNGRIMFVASHVHDKDMPTLFAVAKRLPSQLAIDVFGLTGEETLDGKQLREYAGENIVFKGKMPHNDLLMQYSAYSLLLSTSVSETFGLSVAEAIAHGTPVVCTDSGGVRDFVNEGNGLVVDIRDVDGIVDAIIKVISAQFDSKNMSQRILEKYGNDQYVNCADLLR
jgi:glycosyltransferase involved in cell wall biosynthesis